MIGTTQTLDLSKGSQQFDPYSNSDIIIPATQLTSNTILSALNSIYKAFVGSVEISPIEGHKCTIRLTNNMIANSYTLAILGHVVTAKLGTCSIFDCIYTNGAWYVQAVTSSTIA